MLRLRRLIRLLLDDFFGNNVNMGRHCVFFDAVSFFCAEGMVEGTPGKGMLSGLRLRRGLVLGRRDSAKTVFQKSELAA